MDYIKIIADTKHIKIEKRMFNNMLWYTVFVKGAGWNVFYTPSKAFRFAREEVKRHENI